MKKSISYYIILFVLKLKGLKKDFSQDPIDYKKIRKQDVHDPKGKFFSQSNIESFNILKSKITAVNKPESNRLLIFIHGGAFISGPSQHHWDSIKTLHQQTNQNIWLCDYPKAPEHQIEEISLNIDAVYKQALEKYSAQNIKLMGDSVGGTLIATLTQRLVLNQVELPSKIILVSPVMDASLKNLEILKVDAVDPMLSKKGVLSAKKMCAGELDLKHPIISPLFGSFIGIPRTVLYMAENDITYPDQKRAVIKMKEAKVVLITVLGEGMPHVWPFLPVMKEAKIALNAIIKELND
ncbi:YqiA/YcfP family alpha/beta fold hydrolase [Crocinitomix catalasitica]|uniref:YqiA/YcfP family alpha/beta fold hydrolase n=1 Tax=Crocinitomix catalasitica TaxID=184607 RepID=UPI00048177C1|nr:alpha/beta hydrolase [Crocinitomix catalasitica]